MEFARASVTQRGFTLVELTVVVTILLVLFTMSTISLGSILPQQSMVTDATILMADIHEQRLKAMSGYEAITGGASAYGVIFAEDGYTLFTGPSYNVDSEENYYTPFQSSVSLLETDLPDNTIVFASVSGRVANFVDPEHYVKLDSDVLAEHTVLVVNQLGIVDLTTEMP